MEYARLEQELQGEDYRSLLQELKEKAPFLKRFDTWANVVAFMRDDVLNAQLTDEVLKPIFEAHRKSGNKSWRTILLVIFWPGLEGIYRRKRRWDPDHQERWQNIVWTFLKVVCRIDVSRRPDRLVQKVINDTIHHLYDEYRRIWKIKRQEITPDSGEEFESLGRSIDGVEYAYVELHEAQELEIGKLRGHMEKGRISEADFLLLVGTRVYGRSIADYARETGLNYQVAKKRRLRAEAVIHSHKKICKSCPQK